MSLQRILFVVLVLFVAFDLMASSSYAQSNLNSVQCIITNSQLSIGACVASAIPFSLIGIMLSFCIIGATYIAGDLLNSNQLKEFYRKELWEAIKSMLIIVIIFSSLIIVSAIATSLAGNTYSLRNGNKSGAISTNLAGLYTTANSMYLAPQLQSSYTSFGAIIGLAVGDEALGTFEVSYWLPVPLNILTEGLVPATVQEGADAYLFTNNYIYSPDPTNAFSLTRDIGGIVILPVLFLFQFQSDLLFVIGIIGLGVFVPLGVVMRAIPFYRGIGGTMIALGIGFAIVYPALLVGFNLPITNYIYSLTNAPAPQPTCPFSSSIMCNLWNGYQSLIDAVQNGAASLPGSFTGGFPLYLAFGSQMPNFQQAAQVSGAGFWTGLLGPFRNGIFPAENFVITNSLNSIVQFILFVFDLIIGYAITNGIAKMLGGGIRLGIGNYRLA